MNSTFFFYRFLLKYRYVPLVKWILQAPPKGLFKIKENVSETFILQGRTDFKEIR